MSRIVYETATSLDGYLADEHNSLGWLFAVPGGDDPRLAPPRAAVQVMGSTTYTWVIEELGSLDAMNTWQDAMPVPTVVLTTRDLPIPEGADIRCFSGDVADLLPLLRELAGDGRIWVIGGGGVASQFLMARALDEIVLTVAPAALGQGAPLLSTRIEADQLQLVEVQQLGQFARLVYAVSYPVAS